LSFIVQIWEQPDGFPKPTDVYAACNQVELADERADPARPNARLRAFVEQIRERWPITIEPGFPRDDASKATTELGVWKDDSLQQDIGRSPALVLAIVTDKVDEVLTWMAEAGPLAGVNVADPQNGSAWLADGSVFALNDEGACAKAMARHLALDDRAAWEQFVELAQGGNLAAFGHLGDMYGKARFVGRDPAIAWALHAVANKWQAVQGVPAPSDATDTTAAATLATLRDGLDAAARARADALFERLRAPGLRGTLLAAAGEFDARHVAALDLIARGDVAAAAMRLQPLASRGHVPSQRALALLWAAGRAQPDDPRQELAWIAAAAALQAPDALLALARLYEEGVLTRRNVPQARQIHRRLIAHGATSALRDGSRAELKRLLDIGRSRGPFWDGRSAAELQPLADAGDVEAMVELARNFEWGRVTESAWDRAGPLWRRACEGGHPEAQRRMASMHSTGVLDVPKDDARATALYRLAALQGDRAAQFELAKRLDTGLGAARDRPQAFHWLEQAGRQKLPSALRMMSVFYARGDDHPKDPVAAQFLLVLHDRLWERGSDDFKGPDEVDATQVRRLLAEIDGGADLLEVLQRRHPHRPPTPPVTPADGLSLVPIAAPAAPAAPAAGSPPSSSSREAARPAPRRRPTVVEPEPEPEPVIEAPSRSPIGPILIVVSFAMLAAVVAALRVNAQANITVPWLIASALAAAGAYRISRENGQPTLVAAIEAVPMFVPFIGSALAARMLYFRWRRQPAG